MSSAGFMIGSVAVIGVLDPVPIIIQKCDPGGKFVVSSGAAPQVIKTCKTTP